MNKAANLVLNASTLPSSEIKLICSEVQNKGIKILKKKKKPKQTISLIIVGD